MTETDHDLDAKIKELVEWMDRWECHEWRDQAPNGAIFTQRAIETKDDDFRPEELRDSLDLVREIEDEVELSSLWSNYAVNLFIESGYFKGDNKKSYFELTKKDIYVIATADSKPRLIALHRTLKESGEI
jgi:hypothetical protein